jgi:hypothetical protein
MSADFSKRLVSLFEPQFSQANHSISVELTLQLIRFTWPANILGQSNQQFPFSSGLYMTLVAAHMNRMFEIRSSLRRTRIPWRFTLLDLILISHSSLY